MNNLIILGVFFLQLIFIQPLFAQSYIGALIAYKPLTGADENWGLEEKLKYNAGNVSKIISSMKNRADIIVIPEFALTTTEIMNTLKQYLQEYSMYIGQEGTNPCKEQDVDDTLDTLRNISCAAQNSQIYTVFSIIELENDQCYLTYIVLDRSGTVIKKCKRTREYLYNKDENLQGKPCMFEAKIKGTSVTFAILDDMNVIEEVGGNVSNFIMMNLFKNQLPFEYAPSLQTGIAVRNKINLLAASVFDGTNDYGGSGIYYFINTNLEGHFVIDSISDSQIIAEKVPLGKPSNFPKSINVVSPNKLSSPKHVSTVSLNDTNKVVKNICMENVCCSFEADIAQPSIEPYRWVAAINTTTFLNQKVVAIQCGLAKWKQTPTLKFKSVKITSSFQKDDISQIIPVSINNTFLPTNYAYSESGTNSSITLVGNENGEEIISFGLVHILGTKAASDYISARQSNSGNVLMVSSYMVVVIGILKGIECLI